MGATPNNNKPLIALMGPTASGKSALAMQLVRNPPLGLPLAIISVDSAMVYRGMDIGTAKPTAAELADTPHRLINIKDPAQVYSVGEFMQDLQREVSEVRAQGQLPLLVGGTMMYFNAVFNGLAKLPPADAVVRQQLNQEAQKIGWPAMHARLQEIDPQSFEQLKPNDAKRIQRALEVFMVSGKPMRTYWQSRQQASTTPIISIAIAPQDRAILHQRIAARWHAMIEAGLIEEVAALKQRGDLHADLPSMRCVGYRQVWDYLAGHIDEATMHEKAIVATRRLAKRQMTWLRSFDDVGWFDSGGKLFTQVSNIIFTNGRYFC